MDRNEAKTRKELIDPMLRGAGWFHQDWQIDPEYKITEGRIHFDGKKAQRAKPVYADYLLRYAPSKAIAVVEAKAESKHYLEGEKQAKDYARKLGLWFVYCTNGHEIEFFNLKSNTQTKVDKFHTSEELWEMYLQESNFEVGPISIPERTRAFAYHLLRHLFSTDPLGKTIVFCLNQEHALDMAKYCREVFVHYKEKYNLTDYSGDYAVRITGNDKDHNNKYPDLERFTDLDSYQPVIVTTSKLLTTGVDVKNIKNIVIFRNVGSMVEFKQIIGRGTRTYPHPNPTREKLGFFILEYANYSTQLFNDPEWDDEPQDLIDDEPIIIDESMVESESSPYEKRDPMDASFEDSDSLEPEQEESPGIYEETDEEKHKNIRYRMSEDFLSGRINMAAESISLTGPDGKPITTEEFIIYQSGIFKEHFKNPSRVHKEWSNISTRKKLEQDMADLGLNIDALTNIFFDKHGVRNVDKLDILLNLLWDESYLTKDERVQKARELHPNTFSMGNEEQQDLLKDILNVYTSEEYQPLNFSAEFWEIPQIRKYGGYQGVRDILGGPESIKTFVTDIQKAIYDERIAA